MTGNASAGASENDDVPDVSDYDAMLDTLDVAIEEAREKVENGRVRDVENDKVRIKWVRALAYAVNVRRQVANDRDLEALAEEIKELKELQDIDT